MSKAIVLTADERERFAAWLTQDALSNIALAEQMEKLNSLAMNYLAKQYYDKALSYNLVAKDLRSITEQTIR